MVEFDLRLITYEGGLRDLLPVWRLQPGLEVRKEAWFPVVDRLLITHGFIYRFL